MADPPPYPGTPRWVKVSGTVVGVLILVVVILMLAGVGGPHGPNRHIPSSDADGQTLPSSITESSGPDDYAPSESGD